MFYGCSRLNYIKMLATDISANDCLNEWVTGVSATGVFVKSVGMLKLSNTQNDYIPDDWNVYEYFVESPSIINPSDIVINFYAENELFTPNSNNINLSYNYSDDIILSMQPEISTPVNVVCYIHSNNNMGKMIKENYVWENTKTLKEVLEELSITNNIKDIVIVIYNEEEPEEKPYYY
jgi:hypothetical protein